MKLRQLEYLSEIARTGSFSRAADALYISQPSLTAAIQSLEAEYQVTLLKRTNKGVLLTPEGERFLRYARGVLHAASVLEDNFLPEQKAEKSRLFLATTQLDFVYSLVEQTYSAFSGQPVHYNIEESNRNDILRLVLSGSADIGLFIRSCTDCHSLLWQSQERNLDQYVLQRGKYYALVGPASPFYHRSTVTFSETRQFPNIGLDLEAHAAQDLIIDNPDQHFNLDRMIFLNTAGACASFLQHSNAILFAAQWTVGCFDRSRIHCLEIRDDGKSGPPSDIELVWAKRARYPLNPTERTFIRQLYRHFCLEMPDLEEDPEGGAPRQTSEKGDFR